MATISRLRVGWSGSPLTGAGVSTFYCSRTDMTGIPVRFLTFFDSISNFFPNGITWEVPNSGDQIESSNGDLVGAWSATGGGQTLSSGGAVDFTPGVGMRVRWNTAGIHRGRRVTGTTFLCPLAEQEITAGTVQSTTVNAVLAAANTLISGDTNLVVWGDELPATPTKPFAPGGAFNVLSVTVPSRMTWLRSRRV